MVYEIFEKIVDVVLQQETWRLKSIIEAMVLDENLEDEIAVCLVFTHHLEICAGGEKMMCLQSKKQECVGLLQSEKFSLGDSIVMCMAFGVYCVRGW